MSEFIYRFIGSLSMSEKAYFKRQAKAHSQNKEKNYLRLFDAIDKMEVYDKDKLKAKFAGESIGKYLSSEINYLLDQLLKSLVNFNFDSSVKTKLQKSILNIDILIDKGFQKRALKLLYEAKKMAYRSEDFTTILKLMQIEEEVLFTKGILGFTEQLSILSKERQNINDQISNLNSFRLMREQIRELQFSGIPIEEIKNHPHFFLPSLSNGDLLPLSLSAKQHWYYIFTLGYYIIGDYESAKEIAKKYAELLGKHDYLFEKLTLLIAISNHMYYCALTKDEVAYNNMLLHLNKLENDPSFDSVFISYIKYARGLELYYRMNEPNAGMALMNEVEQFVNSHISDLGTTQSNYLLFLSVRTCIISNEYLEAVDWVNLWRQHGSLKYTLIYSRLFSLILYFELDWNDLLRSEVDTAYKVLKRQGEYNALSKTLLTFFRNCLKGPNRHRELLIKLEADLISIYSEPERKNDLNYFNFLEWCQNKIARLG